MGRSAGKPKTGGRKKGTPNKLTANLKEQILEAAKRAGDELGPDGAICYLHAQAKENPTAFMSLLGKVLPMTLANDEEDGAFKVIVQRFSDTAPTE